MSERAQDPEREGQQGDKEERDDVEGQGSRRPIIQEDEDEVEGQGPLLPPTDIASSGPDT